MESLSYQVLITWRFQYWGHLELYLLLNMAVDVQDLQTKKGNSILVSLYYILIYLLHELGLPDILIDLP